MKKLPILVCLLVLSAAIAAALAPPADSERYWPQWRGPLFNGTAPHADPPIEWSEEKNIAWKIEIPGKGSASPVVWGDQVFVTTAVPSGDPVVAEAEEPSAPETGARRRRGPRGIRPTQVQQFTLMSINRLDGKVMWRKVLREELPHEGTHPTGTWASPSPVTDGQHVYAFFGSWGLYCLTMDGQLLWEKDLGDMEIRLGFGEGSSPVLHGDRIIVSWDHQGESFIVAFEKATGKELWRTARDEITSWSTPIVIEHDGRKQVVTSATGKVRSYDFQTGELIWESAGMTLNTIPSPVFADGMVFVTSGFRGNALLAIRLSDARGDITGTDAIVWSLDRDTPYAPSPLLYKGTLYFVKSNNGILSAFDAATGRQLYGPVRLDDVPNIYASPVGAAGRIYIAGRDGGTVVFEHGEDFKLLATNQLDDGFDASPAAVAGELFLRGQRNLYKIVSE